MTTLKSIFGVLTLALSLEAFALTEGLMFHKASLRHQKSFSQSLSMQTSTFDQKLDHTNPSDTRTFKQRFFVDSQYAENSTSPVFYIICGEWNCGGTSSYGYVVNLARKVKAHLVALEHRYYGESLPTTTLTAANLKYLNLSSAIEDLAQVQKFVMKQKGFTGKWIAFGGSYAGTLSSFYRLKHPELVTGALASSGPVLMKTEFSEYDAHIAKVLNKSACGENARRAVDLIEEKLKTADGSKEVKALFNASEIKLNSDFIYIVADMLAGAVQYGKDKVFCDALSSASDPIAGYAKGGLQVLSSMGQKPFELSMQSAEKVEITSSDYFRQWMWQSCSEFGWFQVANGQGPETARSSQIDLKYHADVCQRLYQTKMTAGNGINELWYAHLFDPKTERIIFSNGGNDPWSTLSVTHFTQQSNQNFPLFLMDNAAHCDDLKAFINLPSVIAAQAQMDKIITQWIQ